MLELKSQLAPLEKRGDLRVWYDGEILPGQDWGAAIKQNLESAGLILLFISKHFFNSEYIQSTELHKALERHAAGLSTVIPIIVRPCIWEDHFAIGRFQALPESAHPIYSRYWHDADEAWVSVAQGIRRVVREKMEEKTHRFELASQQATLLQQHELGKEPQNTRCITSDGCSARRVSLRILPFQRGR